MKTNLHELVALISKEIEHEKDFDSWPLLEDLSPSEIARLIEALPAKFRNSLWSGLPQGEQGEVLLEIHRDIRRWLIQQTPDAQLLAALTSLQIDELA
jgi:magnesium transporter